MAEQYDRNRSLKNYEQHVLNRRRALLDAMAMASRTQDAKARAEAMAAIRAFDAKWPELRITPAAVRKSLKARARYSAAAEHGIFLNKKIATRIRSEVGID